LENGFEIQVVETEYDAVSVDVVGDVARVEKILESQKNGAPGKDNGVEP
jgi:CMP-2-keto-3-deoxyoctulosonic acid synthetase